MLLDLLWCMRKRRRISEFLAFTNIVIGVFRDGKNRAKTGMLKFESSILPFYVREILKVKKWRCQMDN